jgi:probable F420-dependent oxidoreductase
VKWYSTLRFGRGPPAPEGAHLVEATDDISVGFVVGGDPTQAAALETLGVDSLWAGGHVASRNPSTEALMALARLSAATQRVRLGTATLLLPLYPPAIVAKQIADLDRASGGRITLGVGVGGEYPQEFRACEVPIEERGARTDEAIELIRLLWSGERISHHGRFHTMEDVRVHPAPTQPGGPPIVVSGRKAPAMRRAGVLGDGWMPYLYSPRRYAASVDVVRQTAEAAGRSLEGFGWYAFVFVNVDSDGTRARAQVARTLGAPYAQDVEAMVDDVAVAGTTEEVVDALERFVDAGARHFIFATAAGGHGEDDGHIVGRLMGEVVPELRQRHAARGR